MSLGNPKRILALCLVLLALLYVPVQAMALDAAPVPYYAWKQYDERWASVKLSGKTMKQVGCLATSVAMLAVQAGRMDEKNFDPGVFAGAMRAAGGFTSDNDLVWEKIPEAVPGLVAENPWASLSGTAQEKTAKLGRYLDEGYCVAVAVKGGGHWVALRDVKNGTAVMMDPACTSTDLFGKYKAQDVTRAALLKAEQPPVKTPAAAKPARLLPEFELPFEFPGSNLLGLLGDWMNLDMLESVLNLLADMFGFFQAVGKALPLR